MRTMLAAILLAIPSWAASGIQVNGRNIRIEFDSAMRSRVVAHWDGREVALGPFTVSEFLTANGSDIREFAISRHTTRPIRDRFGVGTRTTITGTAGSLEKTVAVSVYDRFPRMAFFEVSYRNTGASALHVTGWANQAYEISAPRSGASPAFWSYQSGSYESRPDWVLPLKPGFRQENYLGMNATDYGGGTPVIDVWSWEAGLAVGHLEMAPKLVSLPVGMPDEGHATVAVRFQTEQTLKPGAVLQTFRTFAAVHRGDYFQALRDYRSAMQAQGVRFDAAPDAAFGPIWCAWGYGKKFTPDQVENALPVVKKLGFTWVGVDDGWQTAQGDWFLEPHKFPRGDADMKALVDRIHAAGFKAQLWLAPLAADPGTELVKQHPEMLLLNADGTRRKISYWNSWYLCPADPAVVAAQTALVVKAMRVWGFDGLKLDGQHMNAVPPCYNPAHHHARPEDAVEGTPRFFQAIYDTARKIKPDALVEFCPCGTAYSFFTLPFMNMSVASDPRSPWQVRTKGKTLKALQGDAMAYFGDHVDMTKDDFASQVGVGAVVGTNFTWPPGSASRRRIDLTPERERTFADWLRIYREKMLSRGEYLGELYDIGFDRPEGHAIRKDGKMYYAFYAPEWDGPVTLRGLEPRAYAVKDYVTGKDLGTCRGPEAAIHAKFSAHLLLEATPLR